MAEDRLHILAREIDIHLAHEHAIAIQQGGIATGPAPSREVIEAILTAGFWASLRREEGSSPRISIVYLPPEQAEVPLTFSQRLPLIPEALAKLAPAVERPGVHLGVWKYGNELYLWGATRVIPPLAFV